MITAFKRSAPSWTSLQIKAKLQNPLLPGTVMDELGNNKGDKSNLLIVKFRVYQAVFQSVFTSLQNLKAFSIVILCIHKKKNDSFSDLSKITHLFFYLLTDLPLYVRHCSSNKQSSVSLSMEPCFKGGTNHPQVHRRGLLDIEQCTCIDRERGAILGSVARESFT